MDVLAALRAATAGEHARLEVVTSLDTERFSLARYGAMLQLLLAVRQGWEPGLAAVFPGAVGPHREWLEADLAVLGLAPLVPEPPLLCTVSEGWGVRYVLEGSALGGRVLLRRAEQMGLTPKAGARYFAGWGNETGARWKAFVAALATAGTPEATPGIIRGALRAFRALNRRASACFDEAVDPRQDFAPPLAAVEDAVMADARL